MSGMLDNPVLSKDVNAFVRSFILNEFPQISVWKDQRNRY